MSENRKSKSIGNMYMSVDFIKQEEIDPMLNKT